MTGLVVVRSFVNGTPDFIVLTRAQLPLMVMMATIAISTGETTAASNQ
ncbi:hypothetical protein J2W69_002819 [Rheinheimera soli]|uniref:Uncharacterized protein n=1 Tax=Rheinheimera soli TaxID=443616 RepID=A0ABU1W1Q3_9GAMM|nr:hypothetical protein [Rheinheimera soli]